VWGGVVPLHTGVGVWEPRRGIPGGAMLLPGKMQITSRKGSFGAYFCVLLLFQHEIIVDLKLPGDFVQAPEAGRLTPVSGGLPGVPGNSGRYTSSLIWPYLC